MPDDEQIRPIRRVDPNLPKVERKSNMNFFFVSDIDILPNKQECRPWGAGGDSHILADQLTLDQPEGGGDKLCPPYYYWHLQIFRPSDGPE